MGVPPMGLGAEEVGCLGLGTEPGQDARATPEGSDVEPWSAATRRRFRRSTSVRRLVRVCQGNRPVQREGERAFGQGVRGGGAPADHAAEGNAGPVSFLPRS